MLIISRPLSAVSQGFTTGTLINNAKAVLIAQRGLILKPQLPETDVNRTEVVGDQLFAADRKFVNKNVDFTSLQPTTLKSEKRRFMDIEATKYVHDQLSAFQLTEYISSTLVVAKDMQRSAIMSALAIVPVVAVKKPLSRHDYN